MDLFVDRALARRLERAEGAIGSTFAEARARLEPGSGAVWREIGGAFAVFDGVESPVTQAFGFGMSGPASVADVEAIEAFFGSHGAGTHHEVCPLAGVDASAILAARGYRPFELSNVLVRGLADATLAQEGAAAVRVRVAVPSDEAVWVDAAVRGWTEDEALAPMIRGFSRVSFANVAMTKFVGEIDGAPVATASLGIHEGVALLAGASTVPSARRRGAQRALLAARLAEAKGRGCEVAMMAAEPGSTSQKNAERSGFRVAYSRTKWRLGGSAA